MAQRGSRGIALPFNDHGTRRGWGVSVTPRPFLTPRKDPVPIVQEAGWAPGPVRTGVENLSTTGIRSLDCPALSQSQYRLSYPAPSTRSERDLLMDTCRVFGYSAIWSLRWNDLHLIREFREYVKYLRDLNHNAGVNVDGRFEYLGRDGSTRIPTVHLWWIWECG